jgi:hypothetical protein
MPRCWWLLLWQQHKGILKSWRWVGFMRVSWFCKLCLSPAILLSRFASFCWGCAASEQQNIGNALLATEVPTASFIAIEFCWFHLRDIIEYSNLLIIILHCALWVLVHSGWNGVRLWDSNWTYRCFVWDVTPCLKLFEVLILQLFSCIIPISTRIASLVNQVLLICRLGKGEIKKP